MDQVAVYSALVATSLITGYWAGTRSRGLHQPEKILGGEDPEGRSREIGLVDEADECKLVLVVRTDLGMSPGKIAAQCSHATLACYKSMLSSNPALLRQWERAGQTKVALRCQDEDELLLLQGQAKSLNLCARSIQDAGRTEIAAGSRTVLGIAGNQSSEHGDLAWTDMALGPGRLVNEVTERLRVL